MLGTSKGTDRETYKTMPQSLTESLVRSLGIRDFASLEELEVIFSFVTSLDGGALNLCTRLQSLTLIDTGLDGICSSALYAVSNTLERLHLSQQNITSMRGLNLPHLKDLFLYENKISRIEGLDGCPQLRRLWLNGNCIRRIEGLYPVGGLRELWLQKNYIEEITGLESLVNLSVLGLAGNNIDSFKDLDRLAFLPSLTKVSFDDIHFGTCPVASRHGYRDFIIRKVEQIACIDGVPLGENERVFAEDTYARSVLEFNDRFEALQLEAERDLARIDCEEEALRSSGKQIESQLSGYFSDLEEIVSQGMQDLHKECLSQVERRNENRVQLEERIMSLVETYETTIDDQIKRETAREAEEVSSFCLMEARAKAEHEQERAIVSLQVQQPTDGFIVACQHLGEHTAEFQYLASTFLGAQQLPTGAFTKLSALQCYRCVCGLTANNRKEDLSRPAKHDERKELMFFCGSIGDTISFLKATSVSRGRGQCLLFSDPVLGARICDGGQVVSASTENIDLEEGYEYGSEFESDSPAPSPCASACTETGSGNGESNASQRDEDSGSFTGLQTYHYVQCNVDLGQFANADDLQSAPGPEQLKDIVCASAQQDILFTYPIRGGNEEESTERGTILVCSEHSPLDIEAQSHILGCQLHSTSTTDARAKLREAEVLLQELENANPSILIEYETADTKNAARLLNECEKRIKHEFRVYQQATKEGIDLDTANQTFEALPRSILYVTNLPEHGYNRTIRTHRWCFNHPISTSCHLIHCS